jgi:hypothetical protein
MSIRTPRLRRPEVRNALIATIFMIQYKRSEVQRRTHAVQQRLCGYSMI